AAEREADVVETSAMEPVLVPDRGHAEPQVSVVGEERHAALRAAAVDRPGVAPPGPAGDDEGTFARIERDEEARARLPQRGDEASPQQLDAGVEAQVEAHRPAPGEAVERGPGL